MSDDNTFSTEKILAIRSEAFALHRHLTATLQSVAAALESLDTALQTAIDERNIDGQQALVTAARDLATIVGRSAVQ